MTIGHTHAHTHTRKNIYFIQQIFEGHAISVFDVFLDYLFTNSYPDPSKIYMYMVSGAHQDLMVSGAHQDLMGS